MERENESFKLKVKISYNEKRRLKRQLEKSACNDGVDFDTTVHPTTPEALDSIVLGSVSPKGKKSSSTAGIK